jgi:MFS transporter, DHA1 family, tetracycline resistance protein
MNGLMSTLTPSRQQGELQGAIASLTSLALILSPPLMTRLFTIFSTGAAGLVFPGAPYLLATVLAAGSLTLLWRSNVRRAQNTRQVRE